jgi:hypothetical protein
MLCNKICSLYKKKLNANILHLLCGLMASVIGAIFNIVIRVGLLVKIGGWGNFAGIFLFITVNKKKFKI